MGRYLQGKLQYWAKCLPSATRPMHVSPRPTWCRVRNAAVREACIWRPGKWHGLKYTYVIVLRVMYLNREHMSNFSSRFSVKGGRCIGLTNLSPAFAGCLEICESQPPGNLRTCPGITLLLPLLIYIPYNLLATQVLKQILYNWSKVSYQRFGKTCPRRA
jgi:hypothetical protein